MNTISRTLLSLTFLFCTTHAAIADRGAGKKTKTNKITLNITTPSSLRGSISFNLKSGLTYKGSLLTSHQTL
jgi:hypothetical protein